MALSMSPMRLCKREVVVKQAATRHKNPHTKKLHVPNPTYNLGEETAKALEPQKPAIKPSQPFVHLFIV